MGQGLPPAGANVSGNTGCWKSVSAALLLPRIQRVSFKRMVQFSQPFTQRNEWRQVSRGPHAD